MKVKEEYVPIENAEMIFDIIKEQIMENKDVQIFVSNQLIRELDENGSKHHIYQFNGSGCCHYNKNEDGSGGEQWYMHTEKDFSSEKIDLASFVKNCKGYYQLVEFPHKNEANKYCHYCVGFEQLLLIETKEM